MLTHEQALSNHAAFESLADVYRRTDTRFEPEQKLLSLLQLADMDMLDLGVGAGRTTAIFAPLVKSYIGVDYSKAMIKTCRDRFPMYEFDCQNAKQLTFGSNAFDFVLFSFNGIDYVELEARQKIFDEVWRVLRPGGCFCFSSHSLEPRTLSCTWTYLNDGTHNGKLTTFYGTMAYQLQEIMNHGFVVEQVMGLNGHKVEHGEQTDDYCLHYLCRKKW